MENATISHRYLWNILYAYAVAIVKMVREQLNEFKKY